ncbi:TniQ family protein [Sphingomonas sp. Y38-1Y]|uniref:TniQ family protein n=1 Tax=Sphingomonas sp. Y38-1Y TaxID=3078265 RepID=UPI0028E6FA7C|nr:TniQ family protein [Sphingomonas sp. Y38-1Y]
MPLAFLPQFHPDELLYSIVARYGRWGRLRTGRVNENLFGTKSIKFSYDLPLQIGRLADTVGADLPLTVSEIVRDHTLLPFHTALRERGEYDELARRMVAGENIQRTLKGTRAVLPWPDRLRYCPECDDVSRRLYGTPIWLRRHQLVTSLICLEHGGILLASDVDVTWGRDMTYRPASDHRGDAQAIAFPFSGEAMMRYRDITTYGHSMLGSQDHRDGWSPETDFKALARRKGFTQGMLTRGVPGLQSMLKTYPLPRTRAALIEEAETHATFTPRKLRWMFEEADRRGEVISLSKLLGRRLFIDRDLVRSEWKRYYEGSGRGETSGSTAG